MSDPSKDPTISFEPESGESKLPAAPMPEPSRVLVGSVLLTRFKLIGHAGEGGTSHVYKAIDLRKVEARLSEPYVAVKLLTAPDAHDNRAVAALQAEAQKLQSLTHPNIVRVFDCDRDGHTVFMTMEYLNGAPLRSQLLAPAFTGLAHEEALRIIGSVASALTLAHRIGIVHGDLKPGNIMITELGEVKVIDFGIARAMTRPKREMAGVTPSYSSPQMLERLEPDPRDDVYALACMSYELLTGRHPFDRADALAARDSGLKVPRSHALTRRQYDAIGRAMRFDREARTATVAQFMDEFLGVHVSAWRWLIPLSAVIVVALAATAYWLHTNRAVTTLPRTSAPAAPATSEPLVPGQVFRDCPTCPLMTVIPAAQFEQGAASDDEQATPFEQPRHPVSIAYPFAMAVNETTRGEFEEFVSATGREMRGCATYDGAWKVQPDLTWSDLGPAQTALHPMSCVSWQDAQAYAQWLSSKTGHRYRLPSASEWEYAAAPADTGLCTQANVADESAAERYPGWQVQACSDGYVEAAPVGSLAPNSFGLHDTLGNVFEWTQDCWQDDYAHAPADGSAQGDGECGEREMRGGSWFTAPGYVRRTYRNHFAQDYRSTSVGMRIVRDMTP